MNPDGLAVGSVYLTDTGTATLYRSSLAAPAPAPPPAPVTVAPRFMG